MQIFFFLVTIVLIVAIVIAGIIQISTGYNIFHSNIDTTNALSSSTTYYKNGSNFYTLQSSQDYYHCTNSKHSGSNLFTSTTDEGTCYTETVTTYPNPMPSHNWIAHQSNTFQCSYCGRWVSSGTMPPSWYNCPGRAVTTTEEYGHTFELYYTTYNYRNIDSGSTSSSNTEYSIATGYTVNFNSNGGSGSMSSQYFLVGHSQAIKSNTFTRSGYNFLGWSRTRTATSPTYTNRQAVTQIVSSGSTTLYAIWGGRSYTISYSLNNGTHGATHPTSYTVNSSARTYTISAPTRDNYDFVNWTLTRSGTYGGSTPTISGSTLTVPANSYGNITLTANWVLSTYTVIMESSGYPSKVGGLAGGFENTGWSGSYGTEHVRSGAYALKITGTTSTPEVTVPTTATVPIDTDTRNHVYYFQYWGYQETLAGASTQIYWPIYEPSMGSIALGPAGQWNMYSFYGTRSNHSLSGGLQVRIDFDNANQAGTIWFDDFLMLDLTEIFGAGNEPSKEWCDTHIISGTNTQTFTVNASVALETKAGGQSPTYDFAGWSTTPKTTSTTTQAINYTNGQTVNNIAAAGSSITLYGVWQYKPFARASTILGGEVRISGNDLGSTNNSPSVTYEAIPYTGYYLIGWYVGNTVYTQNSTTYTGTTLTLPREQVAGVSVVPIFSTNASATPSLAFDLNTSTAITSTIGGEARIVGDTYSTADTITFIADISAKGYGFAGWYVDDILVSTDATTVLPRSIVLGKIVQARFTQVNDSNQNDSTHNAGDSFDPTFD